MGVILGAFAVAAVITGGILFRSLWVARSKRENELSMIATTLGGESDSSCAWANVAGVRITIEAADRPHTRGTERWMYIHAELPAAYPLALLVRPHEQNDLRSVERGTMVDVVVGDPAFDAAFLVEAAPADVVKHLLGPELRALLTRLRAVELETVQRAGSRMLRFALRGWYYDQPWLQETVALLAKTAAAIRDAYAAADAALEQPAVGAPYRAGTDDAPVRVAGAAREAEVEAVVGIRAKRTRRDAILVRLVVLGVFGGMAIFVAGLTMCDSISRR